MSPRCFALIPAAGTGARSGADRPKQYVPLNGEAMLVHTVRAFVRSTRIAAVRVVLAPGDAWPLSQAAQDLAAFAQGRLHFDNVGGASRAASVCAGLKVLAGQAQAQDWVLVHDAARPCITPELVANLVDLLLDDPVGGLLALPVADTVKRADADGRVTATLPRDGLWLAQTPQMFRLGLLREALSRNAMATDEAAAVEALGLSPRLVSGCLRNLKVTFPADFELAERYLQEIR